MLLGETDKDQVPQDREVYPPRDTRLGRLENLDREEIRRHSPFELDHGIGTFDNERTNPSLVESHGTGNPGKAATNNDDVRLQC